MQDFKAFLTDEAGASAAEYVLILALVGLAIIVGAGTLGTKMNTAFTSTAAKIVIPA